MSRVAHLWNKVMWGRRVVGVRATAQGAVRLVRLFACRPSHSVVHLRSGGSLAFAHPGQFSPNLVLFGDLVDPEFAFLRRIAREDWIVLDVGAAIGQFTVFAGLLPVAHVHAYEPIDANLETLRDNIDRNDIADRTTVHRVALSDHDGWTRLDPAPRTYLSRIAASTDTTPAHTTPAHTTPAHTTPAHTTPAHTTPAHTTPEVSTPATIVSEPPNDGIEPVPVRRLHGELVRLGLGGPGNQRIDVVKINVAGDEPNVLAGSVGALDCIDVLILLLGRPSLPWYERLSETHQLGFYRPSDDTFHRIDVVDDRMLSERPWPARHIIALRRAALESLLDGIGSRAFITKGGG